LDFKGKGYVEIRDFIEGKFIYKLPFESDVIPSNLKLYRNYWNTSKQRASLRR